MRLHRNAKLGLAGRLALVQAIERGMQPIAARLGRLELWPPPELELDSDVAEVGARVEGVGLQKRRGPLSIRPFAGGSYSRTLRT
jgi:hypothetical protein